MLFHQVAFFADNDALGSFENLSYGGNLGCYDFIYFKKCEIEHNIHKFE